MTIKHGIPVHPYFCILQPSGIEEYRQLFNVRMDEHWVNPIIELDDPVSGKIIKAEVLDRWHFPLDELPGMFTYLTYGQSPEKLKQILQERYPQLMDSKIEVEFWLLKKL